MSCTNNFITRYLVDCVLQCNTTGMAYGLKEREEDMGRHPGSALTSPDMEAMNVKGTCEEPLNLSMESAACRCLKRQIPN